MKFKIKEKQDFNMKKIIPILLFSLMPMSSFAAVVYERSAGDVVDSPVYIQVEFDDPAEIQCDQSEYWVAGLGNNDFENYGELTPIGTNAGYFQVEAPAGAEITYVAVFCDLEGSQGAFLEGDGNSVIFSISGGQTSSGGHLFSMGNISGSGEKSENTATNLMAAVGSVSTDTFGSIFPYIPIAAGIPLAFFIIGNLISFFRGKIVGVSEKDDHPLRKYVKTKEYLNQPDPTKLPTKIIVEEK